MPTHPRSGTVKIGTIIELSRICAMSGEIAWDAGFFSFGINDITQMVCCDIN